MLKFYKLVSADDVAKFIANRLRSALSSNKTVAWLVPGGSSIPIAAAVSKELSGQDLSRLTVTLTDERYGKTGHPESNWLQLAQAGFRMDGAKLQPVLIGKDQANTTKQFNENLKLMLAGADYSLGFFGIGPDGHTAGILPGSTAINKLDFAAGYKAGNFERITMTPRAIAELDEAVVYATGEAKRSALEGLKQDLSLDQQPAQALKRVPVVAVFNDYKGELL